MPLKTTAIDMNALLDAWEAEREALRARPRSTTHVVDFSGGVEQPVPGGVDARSSVRRSPRTGCVAARGTSSVPLAAERGPSSLVPSPTPTRAGGVASLPAPEMEPSPPGLERPADGGVGARSSASSAVPAAKLARALVSKVAAELEKEGIDASKLREAIEKLEAPLSAERAAQAYDKAREVRKDCPPEFEELGKNAALVVREVLVLQICCTAGSLSDVGFESALQQAFGRQLGPELLSQLHYARSAICRIGRDRVLFERQAPKVYAGEQLNAEQLNELFPAYLDCAVSVGNNRGAAARALQAPGPSPAAITGVIIGVLL